MVGRFKPRWELCELCAAVEIAERERPSRQDGSPQPGYHLILRPIAEQMEEGADDV